MAFPVLMLCGCGEKTSPTAKLGVTIAVIVYFVLFVLAIYLAIRDMQFLPRTSTKIWVFLLAFFLPELYVLLHGISSSAQGVGFFSGAPLPGGSLMPQSLTPSTLGEGLMGPTALSPATTL